PGAGLIKIEIGMDITTTRRLTKRLENLGVLRQYEVGYKDRSSKTYVLDLVRIEGAVRDLQVEDLPPPGGLPAPLGNPPPELEVNREENKNDEQQQQQKAAVAAAHETNLLNPETPEG